MRSPDCYEPNKPLQHLHLKDLPTVPETAPATRHSWAPQQPGHSVRATRATQRIANQVERPLVESRKIAETPAPPPGTAKVKLELQPRTDDELASFGESHAVAMEDNPWFPSPMPSVDDFDARLAAFEAKVTEVDNLRLQLLSLTQQKDQLRRDLEAVFNQRASYVQLVSQGNPDVIATAGLSTRRPRTRAGTLPWPLNLVARVTQIPGQLLITWETVPRARSFIIECTPLTDGPPQPWTTLYLGGQLKHLATDLTPGQRYAFRIATIGGKDGRSAWSPMVERMAA